MITQLKFKRGLAARWAQVNPILAEGEPGWTLDTHILKVGDGVTPWNELKSVSDSSIPQEDRQNAIDNYIKNHPITVVTDTTLKVVGAPADAAAVREQCLFKGDQLILQAGDADDNIFE